MKTFLDILNFSETYDAIYNQIVSPESDKLTTACLTNGNSFDFSLLPQSIQKNYADNLLEEAL